MDLPSVLTREFTEREPIVAREQLLSEEGGIILLDKPYGETSFFVVNQIRKGISRSTGIKWVKVGHAGTLDPLATGLLVIATRRMTKQMPAMMGLDKTYTLRLRLGLTSESFDLERPITITSDLQGISEQTVLSALSQFRGELSQIPPAHSAIKQHGKPVYLQARKGIETELQPRSIFVRSMSVTEMAIPYVGLQVECSKGTYIRSLVRDIGDALGTGAVLVDLRRDTVGPWSIEDAVSLHHAIELVKPAPIKEEV